MFNPLIGRALGFNSHTTEDLSSNVGDERCVEAAGVGALYPKRASVCFLLDVDTPVPIIVKANGSIGTTRGNVQRSLECSRKGRAQVLKTQSRFIDRVPALECGWIGVAGLESSVADQFGVETTVS